MTTTAPWAELVSAALVGTDRRAPAADQALPSGTDPAQALLRQAMLIAVPALTGTPPEHYEGELPEPAPADERPLIPRAAQLRLRAVLDVYPKYLGEWLAAVQASGHRLPSAALPGLLEAGRNNISIRGPLARVLGARGQWLARQNPDWRYLLREPFGPLRPEDWEGPDPDARIAYLNGLYATDAPAARALLQAAWPTLTAAAKRNLLGLVNRHGTKADLPFLQALAQDSSKQVRDEARGIEARLEHREEESTALSPEGFAADVARLAPAGGGAGIELYRYAVRRNCDRWPLDGARAILAALVESGREVQGETGDQAGARQRNRDHWGEQLLILLADCAPPELRPDAELVLKTQMSEIAAGTVYHLDFSNLLTSLGFRADMHAELTASADAAPGQE